MSTFYTLNILLYGADIIITLSVTMLTDSRRHDTTRSINCPSAVFCVAFTITVHITNEEEV